MRFNWIVAPGYEFGVESLKVFVDKDAMDEMDSTDQMDEEDCVD